MNVLHFRHRYLLGNGLVFVEGLALGVLRVLHDDDVYIADVVVALLRNCIFLALIFPAGEVAHLLVLNQKAALSDEVLDQFFLGAVRLASMAAL